MSHQGSRKQNISFDEENEKENTLSRQPRKSVTRKNYLNHAVEIKKPHESVEKQWAAPGQPCGRTHVLQASGQRLTAFRDLFVRMARDPNDVVALRSPAIHFLIAFESRQRRLQVQNTAVTISVTTTILPVTVSVPAVQRRAKFPARQPDVSVILTRSLQQLPAALRRGVGQMVRSVAG